MTIFPRNVVLVACCSLLSSCADHRLNHSDEQAMMIYRECMADMRATVASADMSEAISNAAIANENTSIAANARSRQEQNHDIFCMRQAGWKN